MKYIIGIDGGGTKTHLVAADSEGKVVFECKGGASNFLILGTKKVSQTILDLIDNCKENLNIDYSDIAYILLGTTGAGRRNDAERLEDAFLELTENKGIKIDEFHVESDARIALEAAFSGKPGSILIAGTGSIMFGKDSEGVIHRAGGFGRYLGDEGSGYKIGKKGLTAVAREFDGRGESTLITDYLENKFNIDDAEKLITEVYKNNFDIASAAPLVIEAAENGDHVALQILEEESDELLLHIFTMAKKLKQPQLNVSFIGGIIKNENAFSKMLITKAARQMPNVSVKEPEHEPAYGAVLMAKEFLNEE